MRHCSPSQPFPTVRAPKGFASCKAPRLQWQSWAKFTAWVSPVPDRNATKTREPRTPSATSVSRVGRPTRNAAPCREKLVVVTPRPERCRACSSATAEGAMEPREQKTTVRQCHEHRGRTPLQCFHFACPNARVLPAVRGRDWAGKLSRTSGTGPNSHPHLRRIPVLRSGYTVDGVGSWVIGQGLCGVVRGEPPKVSSR